MIADEINLYLADQTVTANYMVFYTGEPLQVAVIIIECLENDKPVTASMLTSLGGSYNHAVVVYDVDYDASDKYGTAVYTAHMGPGNYPLVSNPYAALLNAKFFSQCGYIECGYEYVATSSQYGYYKHVACYPYTYFSSTQCRSYCECGAFLLKHHNPDADGYCEYCSEYISDE